MIRGWKKMFMETFGVTFEMQKIDNTVIEKQ